MKINFGHGFIWLFCSLAFSLAFNSASAEEVISPGLVKVVEIKKIEVQVIECVLGPQGGLLSQNQIPRGSISNPQDPCEVINTSADGVTNPEGEIGAVGESGQDGAQGASGQDGAPGATGLTGAPGATGLTGAQGASGPQGERGATGLVGPQGATGVQGAQGLTGGQGATGAQGERGNTGPVGPVGATGPQGPAGNLGEFKEIVLCVKNDHVMSIGVECNKDEVPMTFLYKD